MTALIGTDSTKIGYLWKGVQVYLKTPGGKTVISTSPATQAQVKGVAEYTWSGIWNRRAPVGGKLSHRQIEKVFEVT
jgi:hypothetical protein